MQIRSPPSALWSNRLNIGCGIIDIGVCFDEFAVSIMRFDLLFGSMTDRLQMIKVRGQQ